MNDFDYDALQKKRVACGAKHRVRAKRGCRLPSDSLTAAQKRRLNGEVKTYNMNAPMAWAEFKEMPDDLKVTYLNHLADEYQANQKMIAGMFGVTPVTVHKICIALGVAAKNAHIRGSGIAVDRDRRWAEFLNGGMPAAEPGVEETTVAKADEETANCDTPFNKQDLIAAHETPDKPVMKSLRVEFEDVYNWVDLYTRVMGLPELNGAKVTLSVEW